MVEETIFGDGIKKSEQVIDNSLNEKGRTDAPVNSIDKDIEERKKKIINFLKNGKNKIYYLFLAFIVWLSVFIRTRNIPGLKDITTNTWTLGPDLDPFLFLRWAKYIVANGSLMAIDTMRNVPLGLPTAYETRLLPYMIAYLYKAMLPFQALVFSILKNIFFVSLPFNDMNVEFAGVIYPVVIFAFTTVAFFFLVREIFSEKEYANIIAVVATLFLVVSPSLLSRTIAGIPEKEGAVVFMFAAFYFLLKSWKQKSMLRAGIFGVLSGLMSALLGLVWGGLLYLDITIAFSILIAFLLGKVDSNKIVAYLSWLVSFNIILFSFTQRYTLSGFLNSPMSSLIYLPGLLFAVHYGLWKMPFIQKNLQGYKKKMSPEIISTGITIVIGLFVVVVFIHGIKDFSNDIKYLINLMITPIRDRFNLTVAENRQPYFGEWRASFGPDFYGIPLFFWLFFIGSILLVYEMLAKIEVKRRYILTGLYLFMLLGVIFSRYSEASNFNGVNSMSQALYFGSILLFFGFIFYYYIKDYREGKNEFKNISFNYLLVFVFFFVSLAAARSAVRLIMMLSPPAAIIVGFFSVFIYFAYRKYEGKYKVVLLICAAVIIIATAYTFYYNYQASRGSAQGFVPSAYTNQWQKAMSWVRDNTAKDAVFAHWWDYGYWLQSIGERATVLDGGNAMVYWDHLMGRHVLTGGDLNNSLTFLYTHDATHLLIDSTDIGKYGAYASIGGNENHDRASFIPTLTKNDQQTFETRNETVFVYPTGIGLDEDIVWEDNSSKKLFPAGAAGIAGVLIKIDKNTLQVKQPEVVIFYQNAQTRVPLRYFYYNNTLIDYKSGIDAGIRIVPRLIPQGNQVSVDSMGALLYFSRRTVHSFMARLYLFNEENEGFELVHTEPNLLIEDLRRQGLQIEDFAFYGDIMGPIKIWKINYPKDIKENPEWLKTSYPDEKLIY